MECNLYDVVNNLTLSCLDQDKICFTYDSISESKTNAFKKLNPNAEIIISVVDVYNRNRSVKRLKRYGIGSVDEYLESAPADTESVNASNLIAR